MVYQTVKKFPDLYGTPMYYNPFNNSPKFDRILNKINSINAAQSEIFKIHFNIILRVTHIFSKWSYYFMFSNQNPVSISPTNTWQIPSASLSSLYEHPNNICFVSFRSAWPQTHALDRAATGIGITFVEK
jgi:hypothetical protein